MYALSLGNGIHRTRHERSIENDLSSSSIEGDLNKSEMIPLGRPLMVSRQAAYR